MKWIIDQVIAVSFMALLFGAVLVLGDII